MKVVTCEQSSRARQTNSETLQQKNGAGKNKARQMN